jgi:hypothetical protein
MKRSASNTAGDLPNSEWVKPCFICKFNFTGYIFIQDFYLIFGWQFRVRSASVIAHYHLLGVGPRVRDRTEKGQNNSEEDLTLSQYPFFCFSFIQQS